MRRTALFLLAVDIIVICCFGIFLTLGNWPDLVNLDGEQNLGAWWGGGKLLIAGAALLAVPLLSNRRRTAGHALYWVAGLGLIYLSGDEILALHERITAFNQNLDLGIPMFRGRNGAWIFVYLGLLCVLLVIFARPIFDTIKADPKSATIFLAGCVVWISGGIVSEVLGYYGALGGMGSPSQVGIEESLELFGVTFMALGCIRHALEPA